MHGNKVPSSLYSRDPLRTCTSLERMLTSTKMHSSKVIVCVVLCAVVFLSQDTCAQTTNGTNVTTAGPITAISTPNPIAVSTDKPVNSSTPLMATVHVLHSTDTNATGKNTKENPKNSGEYLHAPSFITIMLTVCALLYGFTGQF